MGLDDFCIFFVQLEEEEREKDGWNFFVSK